MMGWFSRKKKEPKPPPPRPKPPRIRRSVIELICATARSQHPHEFGGLLRAEKGVITEIMMLPGTVSGPSHAIFQFYMLPIDFSVRGTVHSHPGSVPRPSEADLDLFRRFGTTHIIIAEPYTPQTWRAYDGYGAPIDLEVID